MSYLKKQEVALGEKLGYSLGDVAANLVFQMMMVFQLEVLYRCFWSGGHYCRFCFSDSMHFGGIY